MDGGKHTELQSYYLDFDEKQKQVFDGALGYMQYMEATENVLEFLESMSDEKVKSALMDYNQKHPQGQSDANQAKEQEDAKKRTEELKKLADSGQYVSRPEEIDDTVKNFTSEIITPKQALDRVFNLRGENGPLIENSGKGVMLHVYIDYKEDNIPKDFSKMERGSLHTFYSMINENQSIMTSFTCTVVGKTNMLQMNKDNVYRSDDLEKSVTVYHYTRSNTWGCYIQKMFLLAILKCHKQKENERKEAENGRVTILLTLPRHQKSYASNFEELIRQCRLFYVYPIDVCIRIASLKKNEQAEKISFHMGPKDKPIYIPITDKKAQFNRAGDGKVIAFSNNANQEGREEYKMLRGNLLHKICYPFPCVYSIRNQNILNLSNGNANRLFVEQCHAYPELETAAANEGKIHPDFFIAIKAN